MSALPESAVHPRLELDEATHQPVRLSILAQLAQSKQVDFAFFENHRRVLRLIVGLLAGE